MATPSSSQKESVVEDDLDPASPKFDPLKALYAGSAKAIVPGAKQFNNLAEFENFLQGKDARSVKQKTDKKQSIKRNILADRAAAKQLELERRQAILAKNAGPAERKARRRMETVLTRMDRFDKGPLSLLRRCVADRLRVIVVVRAAVAVRSHCRGFVVAFDKHFNLALMDVDEKFIRPRQLDKVSKKTVPEPEAGAKLSKETERLSIDSDCSTGNLDKNQHGAVTGKQGTKMKTTSTEHHVDLREKLKLKSKSKTLFDDQVTSNKNASKSSANVTSACSAVKLEGSMTLKSECRLLEYRGGTVSDSDMVKSGSKHAIAKHSKSDVDSVNEGSDGEGIVDRQTKSGKVCKSRYKPFWPLYITWAENRCHASYEIVTRHVNQLFIRGDNVVSVSIAR